MFEATTQPLPVGGLPEPTYEQSLMLTELQTGKTAVGARGVPVHWAE
jgi:hypothetical protein